MAVWREWARDRDDQTGRGIWAARFDPDAGWEEPVLVDESGSYARVSMNIHGRATVVSTGATVWAATHDPSTGWEPSTQLGNYCFLRSDSDGANKPVIAGLAYDAHVAANDRGEAIAIWRGTGTATLTDCDHAYGPKVSRYVPGVGWDPPTALWSNWGHNNQAPLGMDEHGRSLVGALRHSPDVGWGLLDFVPHSNASVAMANDGRALVAWRQGDWILGSRLSPDGEWSPPEAIGARMSRPQSDTDLSASKSLGIMDSNGIDLAINASGELMVVWHTVGGPNYNPPHTSWRFSIWANRFEPGMGWGTPTPLSTNDTIDAYSPRITMDEDGRGIAVWHEARGGVYSDLVRMWWSRYE